MGNIIVFDASASSCRDFIPVRVPVLSLIGASTSMPIDYFPIMKWREIRPIAGAGPNDRFCAAHINGNSLQDEAILDGDYAIFRVTFDEREITPGKLVAVMTPCGLLVKHIYPLQGGRVRLASANDEYEDLYFDAKDVRVQGIVVRVERDYLL